MEVLVVKMVFGGSGRSRIGRRVAADNPTPSPCEEI